MSRIARAVVPGLPHLVTQRGDHHEKLFFEDGDYALYRDLLAERARKLRVEIWGWCLMPNHVHLILVPKTEDGLARAIGETHRRYTAFVNVRARQTGQLFQGRFSSVVMDEVHLAAALRYVTLNPVRAKLARRALDWPWSSARAHLKGIDDGLTLKAPALDRFPDFSSLLKGPSPEELFEALRRAELTGRPVGGTAFLTRLEKRLGRPLRPQKRGPKPRKAAGGRSG
ncbi:MAG: transposase [Aestuariivirga sp.]